MQRLDVIDITTEIPWHPVLHSDDPLAFRSMNKNSAFQATRKDPAISKGGVLEVLEANVETKEFHHQDEDIFSAETEEFLPQDDEDNFFDTKRFGDSFGLSKHDLEEHGMFFFDPDDITEKEKFGRAFHLTLNCAAFQTKREEPHLFVRDSTVNEMLDRFSSEDSLTNLLIHTHTPFALCIDFVRMS
jgi:hypothetical protein